MTAHTRSMVPFLHVADVERSIAFYADLGFTIHSKLVPDSHTAPTWAWLISEKANLMVGQASGPIDAEQQAILFYLYYDDIRATHAALVALCHAPHRRDRRREGRESPTPRTGRAARRRACACHALLGDDDTHEAALLSQPALAIDGDRDEEDDAWAHLQP